MPRAPTSSAELIDLIRKSGIVSTEKLAGVSDLALPEVPQKAAAALVAQGIVTKFQAVQLLAGRHKGFKIGAYTILDLLGRGGMGAVYLAEHMALHRKVAIKILVPGKEEDQKLAMERFQREARSAAALDHPNIVRIFDVARHNGVPYLVMEYVEGETLQQVIDRDGAIPYTTAAEYIAQAAAGLQHAYEKGFVHRDIKPGNLLRDHTGTIKILDMGLARSANAQDKLTALLDNGAVVGTADFIAPEQAINNPSIDIRADIYSLGASLFSLIIGKPPFEGNTTQKLLQHQLRSAPALASVDATLPRGLSEVVSRMLAKKPEDRFSIPAEVIAALTPWMASSARTLVGISCTRLAEDESLQATLSGIHRNSSAQLPAISASSDSSVFPDRAAEKETAEVSSSMTRRDSWKSVEPQPPARSRRKLLAGLAILFLAAGALGGWLAFGRNTKPTSSQSPNEPQTPAVTTPPANAPAPTNETPADGERSIYKFEASGQPFSYRLGLVADPGDPGKTREKILTQTGPGAPPADWRARCWNKDSEMDFFLETFGGKTAIGIRNARSPASAMLFTPSFECASGLCRLKVEYQASLKEKKFNLRFKPADQRAAWDVATPQVTGNVWRTEDLIVDLKGAIGGYFEFHNTDSDPRAALRLRCVAITELNPAAADKVLFHFDAAGIPDFQCSKLGHERKSGDAPPKIPGLSLEAYKKETINEWVSGPVNGVKALGFTNVNDVKSTQLAVELESEQGLKLRLQENQRLRVSVVYRTTGAARGSIYYQTYGDWKWLGSVPLANSNADWKTATLLLVRGEKPIRIVIDTSEPGAGNTLYIRSITVTEIGKVKSAPAEQAAWVEGESIYKLDIASIPQFRVQKEQYTLKSGDPEMLPPGIGCLCWKEKSLGEFRCERVNESAALSLSNLNDQVSAQYYFKLEGELKVPLQAGKVYRAKISYLTQYQASGSLVIQVTPGYHTIASTRLAESADQWSTASVDFTRPAADDNVEVRMVIDNNTFGESNILCFRSLEILELIQSK